MACPITYLEYTPSLYRHFTSYLHSSYDASPLGLFSSPEKAVIFGKGKFFSRLIRSSVCFSSIDFVGLFSLLLNRPRKLYHFFSLSPASTYLSTILPSILPP